MKDLGKGMCLGEKHVPPQCDFELRISEERSNATMMELVSVMLSGYLQNGCVYWQGDEDGVMRLDE